MLYKEEKPPGPIPMPKTKDQYQKDKTKSSMDRLRDIIVDGCPLFYKAVFHSCTQCPFIENDQLCLLHKIIIDNEEEK